MAIEIVFEKELSDWEVIFLGKRAPNTNQERRLVELIRLFAQMRDLNGLLSLGHKKFEKLRGDLNGLYSSRIPGERKKDRLIMSVEEFTYEDAVAIDPRYAAKLGSKDENLVMLILHKVDTEHYEITKRWWKGR